MRSLIIGIILLLEGSVASLVGDTYSCFSEFQSITTESCQSRIEDENGNIIQEAVRSVQGADFCVSGPSYGPAKQGNFGKAKNYIVSATMKMEDMGKYSKSYGFLGIAFNMLDTKNYDITYVRPHADEHCWEIGYVEDGVFFGRDFGECNSDVKREFNIAVKSENGRGFLYVNGALEREFTSFFPPVNKVASALRNNMVAKMTVSGLELCQEISCVSRDEAGRTVITKAGGRYQEKGMGACEDCVCGLYGQVRCGCRSADEQNVICPADQIAAVGHDCCARCVPPSATCTGSGDPHYYSFDNLRFDFQGGCTYCMVKTNDFQVNAKNLPAGRVSYNQYCFVKFDGDEYLMNNPRLALIPAGEEGRKELATPYKKFYKSGDYVYCPTSYKCEIYIKNEKMLSLVCDSSGFNSWIHGTYYERTECMCGRWDGNPGNDYSIVPVANDMETNCPTPPDPGDPCDSLSREEKNWAEQYCARYKQEPFKSCPVSVTSYFESCKFDACADPSNDVNVCENAATYVAACAAAGHPVEGWRSPSFCPMECDNGKVFDSCGHGCFPTCAEPNPSNCEETCQEGCYCPAGTVLEDGICIEASDCRCLFEGEFVDNGSSWNDTVLCETCTCIDGGIIDCNPVACGLCPAGEVPVSYVGSCCPVCLADWTEEKEETVEVTEEEGPAVMTCELRDEILVTPDDITWKYANGAIISPDNKPDNMEFSDDMLTLTVNPASLTDGNDYICEVVFNGVVGECNFNLIVNPTPPANYIELDGDSPVTVKEGDCATLSVKLTTDVAEGEFSADDFEWVHNPGQKPIDFDGGKYSLSNGGKTLKICDAVPLDEGVYEVCVTKDDVTDCEEIELAVLVVCESEDGSEHIEDEVWKKGEFTECTCTPEGVIECTCIEQTVECGETEESYYDECELKCTVKPAECLVTGDPHYTTFDGARHDFQGGDCRFTLVKTADFHVIGTNVHRGGNEIVSWNNAVELVFKGMTFFLGPEGEFKLNGEDSFLPYKKVWRTAEEVSVSRAGNTLVVSVKLPVDVEALDITWDGNSTVSTTVHGKYYETTSGLCGVWDGNPDNDQTSSGGGVADVADFGWSWKNPGDTCEEEPERPHPCDESLFPEAKPLADESCDVLMREPFSACHGVIEVDTALYNCKYDTCSCADSSCACHAVKNYVKQCVEAGVEMLDSWREFVDYCPLDCHAGLFYDPCGSFCPPTCGDRDPDCGNLAGQCNEGCFCPQGQYLQEGKCVSDEECTCTFQGEVKNVGDAWLDANICSDCTCRENGEVSCVKLVCDKCNKREQSIFVDDDACCPTCVEDWLVADPAEFRDVPQFTDITLSCEAAVNPNIVEWYFSPDNGQTWTQIEGQKKLVYRLENVSPEMGGIYKCKAKKNFKSKEVEIPVTVGAAPTSCTGTAPENGSVEPEEVEIGGVVTYSCNPGFTLTGEERGTCLKDGSIDNVLATCVPAALESISLGDSKAKVKKGKVDLSCATKDKTFGPDATISFFWLMADGSQELISDSPTYSKKKSDNVYTVKGVSAKKLPSKEVVCKGENGDGSKIGTGTVDIK